MLIVSKRNLFCHIGLRVLPHLLQTVIVVDSLVEDAIVTVSDSETFYPLGSILSSLSANGSYFCPASKIYLEPLVYIIGCRCPTSVFTTAREKMESAEVGSKAV